MAFVLEIGYETHQKTIPNTLISLFRQFGIEGSVTHENGLIVCSLNGSHPRLQEALEKAGELLPASIFLRGSRHRFDDRIHDTLPEFMPTLPLGLGVCPQCQKEMFDPASQRYYYPFTSCKNCGGQYGMFERYPYVRDNTQLRFSLPCEACSAELSENPFRFAYPQIGCHRCGIKVAFREGENLLEAADAASFKVLFEAAAGAIVAGKRLRLKSTMGYRTFYRSEQFCSGSVLMLFNASKMMSLLSLIDEEFNALMSIERPILHAALRDEELISHVGHSADVQYPDDGFALLLCRELLQLGLDTVAYEICDEAAVCDATVDFDRNVRTQSPMRLFMNKETRFIAEGERVSFPAYLASSADVASFAHNLVALGQGEGMIIDRTESFTGTTTSRINALEGEELPFSHNNIHRFEQDSASFMAVLSENGLRSCSAVGAYFDESITFLYAKNGHITRVIPSEAFEGKGLIDRIRTLREGSDRLVENLRLNHSGLYRIVETIETSGAGLLEAAAMIIGLEDPGAYALMRESLHFSGKGGVQIDTRLKDNRFDGVAFLASIISYKIADVPSNLLCYSVFESLGDYFSDILTELKNRSKAERIVLCGSGFANQSLYSRVVRNLKQTPPVLARSFPIGRENGVLGGIYL